MCTGPLDARYPQDALSVPSQALGLTSHSPTARVCLKRPKSRQKERDVVMARLGQRVRDGKSGHWKPASPVRHHGFVAKKYLGNCGCLKICTSCNKTVYTERNEPESSWQGNLVKNVCCLWLAGDGRLLHMNRVCTTGPTGANQGQPIPSSSTHFLNRRLKMVRVLGVCELHIYHWTIVTGVWITPLFISSKYLEKLTNSFIGL